MFLLFPTWLGIQKIPPRWDRTKYKAFDEISRVRVDYDFRGAECVPKSLKGDWQSFNGMLQFPKTEHLRLEGKIFRLKIKLAKNYFDMQIILN